MGNSNSEEERVILVNERDEEIGTMGKLEAHQQGALHRAFSVFLFDDIGRLLVQKRAVGKYHSGGLWTNTCCSHPRPGETLMEAARRRLQEEMGVDAPLEHRFSFLYKASFDNGLHEHELDHVFFGSWSGPARPDPEEAEAWNYMSLAEIEADMLLHPDHYTVWLRTCWDKVRDQLKTEVVRPS